MTAHLEPYRSTSPAVKDRPGGADEIELYAQQPTQPRLLARLGLGVLALAAAVWTVAAYTFGLLQGADVLGKPLHNGPDYADRIQIATRNYGWVSAFQGLGLLALQVAVLGVAYWVARRYYARKGTPL